MRLGRLRLACAALALALSGACQPAVEVGDACMRASDCSATLTCALGRCREACVTSADCPALARCLVEPATGAHACSLAVDACTTHGCARGLVCSDGECVNACGTLVECADGACVDGACVTMRADAGLVPEDAGPLDGGSADASASDASPPDAGPPDLTCAGATLVTPTALRTDVPYDPAGLTSTTGGCDPFLPDAYFVLRLAQRSLVAVWTNTPHGGSLGWVTRCDGSIAPDCRSFCRAYTEIAAELAAGDHVVVLDDAEATTLHVIAVPLPDDVVAEPLAVSSASFSLDTSLVAGTGLGTCGSAGPTHLWWTYLCYLGTPPMITFSSCGSATDVDLAVYDDATGDVLYCGAADASCASGAAQSVTFDRLTGPALLALTASGHGTSDVGAVHVDVTVH